MYFSCFQILTPLGYLPIEKRLSRTRAKEAHTAGAYPSFYSLKQLRVLLLPPGWDASPSQGYPQQYVAGTHFKHLGGQRLCGAKTFLQGNNAIARPGRRTTDLQI